VFSLEVHFPLPLVELLPIHSTRECRLEASTCPALRQATRSHMSLRATTQTPNATLDVANDDFSGMLRGKRSSYPERHQTSKCYRQSFSTKSVHDLSSHMYITLFVSVGAFDLARGLPSSPLEPSMMDELSATHLQTLKALLYQISPCKQGSGAKL